MPPSVLGMVSVVMDEPVGFVIQEFRKRTDRFGGIYRAHPDPDSVKKKTEGCHHVTGWSWETVGYRPITPKHLPRTLHPSTLHSNVQALSSLNLLHCITFLHTLVQVCRQEHLQGRCRCGRAGMGSSRPANPTQPCTWLD